VAVPLAVADTLARDIHGLPFLAGPALVVLWLHRDAGAQAAPPPPPAGRVPRHRRPLRTRPMQTLGINYDTGVVVDGTSTRDDFDDRTVRRELEIIAGDLHANAVRVTGDRVDRLEVAAQLASAAGLQVWFSPFLYDLGPDELVERLAACADRAERLRRAAPTSSWSWAARSPCSARASSPARACTAGWPP
jgi:hypothetical protein